MARVEEPGHPRDEEPGHPNVEQPLQPRGDEPGHPRVEEPGHSSVEQPGHPRDEGPGHPCDERPGHPCDEKPGRPLAEEPGHPRDEEPVHPLAEEPGHPSVEQPLQPRGNEPGHPRIEEPGHPSGKEPGHPCNEEPGHSNVEQPVHPRGDEPGHPSVEQPLQPRGDEPEHPRIEEPGHPRVEEPGHPRVEPCHPRVEEPGHPRVEEPGHPRDEGPGHPCDEEPGQPFAEEPGRPSVEQPRHLRAEEPEHPRGEEPGHPLAEEIVHQRVEQPRHPRTEEPEHPRGEVPGHPLAEEIVHQRVEQPRHLLAEEPGHPHGEANAYTHVTSPVISCRINPSQHTQHSNVQASSQRDVQFTDISKFQILKVLRHSDYSVELLAQHVALPSKAAITLKKARFDVDERRLQEAITGSRCLTELLRNDVFSQHTAHLPPHLNKVEVTIRYPVAAAAFTNFAAGRLVAVRETAELYAFHSAAFIMRRRKSHKWIYNILNGKREADRVILRDADPLNGFVLLPDMKWTGEKQSDLFCQAIVNRRDLASLRVCTSPPSTPAMKVGMEYGKVHPLDMVISNLEIYSDYYRKVTLTLVGNDSHPHPLLRRVEMSGEAFMPVCGKRKRTTEDPPLLDLPHSSGSPRDQVPVKSWLDYHKMQKRPGSPTAAAGRVPGCPNCHVPNRKTRKKLLFS
ncbi:uncharacterized protein LOC108682235 [Hyalella azteca]|uniref:m7GpppX diphosphatase n=1 Tax=Hyalella azteca TaxID=294128 RepID=A0A8B7PKZ1_HYAAZ|nr:uncharacterized protein LOC108682235 [Hyalella azteca]